MIREYERVLYDVPQDGQGGFWAILRGLRPHDSVIRFDEIRELKLRAAQCAEQTEFGPSPQAIGDLFGERSHLDTAALVYVAHAMGRDIIVTSSDERFGCDLFTAEGDTFHYDSVDEVYKEAANGQTIWLHNINNTHWAVALEREEAEPGAEGGEASGRRETHFLLGV
jgi:hypothetical protein